MSRTVHDFGDYDVLFPPDMYCVEDEIINLFTVPNIGSVGTIDIDNALSMLNLGEDGKLKRSVVKKNYLSMVSGPFDFSFVAPWSDREIAYSQSQGFLLVDISAKEVEIFTILHGMFGGTIGKVAFLPVGSRTFVLEELKDAGENESRTLRVIRFGKGDYVTLGERSAGLKTLRYSEPWFVHQNRIFIYTDSTTTIEAFDENFSLVQHLLAGAFMAHKNSFRCMEEISVHPTLPFAVIVERGKRPSDELLAKVDSLPSDESDKAYEELFAEVHRKTLYLFRWEHPDPKQQLVPLITSGYSIWNSYNPADAYSDFTFSPDGKWLVFRDKSVSSDNPTFVAVPVEESNPLFLGKPVKLGPMTREGANRPFGSAWMTGPTSWVVSDGYVLHRWNLENIPSLPKEKVTSGTPDPWVEGMKR